MILYTENPNDTSRKPELINEFGKVASYKINTQKSLAFLYTNYERSLLTVIAAMKFKRCLLLGRKVMTNLDSILKGRVINLPTKVCIANTMVFQVIMYGYESWTIKMAEC